MFPQVNSWLMMLVLDSWPSLFWYVFDLGLVLSFCTFWTLKTHWSGCPGQVARSQLWSPIPNHRQSCQSHQASAAHCQFWRDGVWKKIRNASRAWRNPRMEEFEIGPNHSKPALTCHLRACHDSLVPEFPPARLRCQPPQLATSGNSDFAGIVFSSFTDK